MTKKALSINVNLGKVFDEFKSVEQSRGEETPPTGYRMHIQSSPCRNLHEKKWSMVPGWLVPQASEQSYSYFKTIDIISRKNMAFELKLEIMLLHHNSSFAGHRGVETMFKITILLKLHDDHRNEKLTTAGLVGNLTQ
jgi:hypothetical protein